MREDQFLQTVREGAESVHPDWTEDRAVANQLGMARKRRHRAIGRGVGATATLVLVIGTALLVTRAKPATVTVDDGVIRFADGSTATPRDPQSTLAATTVEPTRAVVRLASGGGRFAVTKNPARVFRVEAGVVVVEVLGTRFSVEHSDARARVTVEEGRVRVSWPQGSRELVAGESGLFPPSEPEAPSRAQPAAEVDKPVLEKPRDRPKRAPKTEPKTETRPTWRELAEEGDYDRAYEELKRPETPPLRDQAAELLLAADVARLSHHASEAVQPLKSILREHRDDPRAPLAAFTLGRVLLEELGRPREAAEAFADAASLEPRGPIEEDAVAREVEAWSRAGDSTRARQRADEYLKRYPDGRRIRSVKRFGGLE
jgi:transmembrane sensor